MDGYLPTMPNIVGHLVLAVASLACAVELRSIPTGYGPLFTSSRLLWLRLHGERSRVYHPLSGFCAPCYLRA